MIKINSNVYIFANAMAKTASKIISDPQIGEVVFRKSSRSRNISIRVHPVKGVSVSIPHLLPYAAGRLFFESRRGWILETMDRQRRRAGEIRQATPEEIDLMRRQAKAELPVRLAELASRYGFIYNRVAIKHNATNWGSCSARNNINLNLNIVRLPAILRDYVLLHELCHLCHHDHGHAFHLLLEHLLTDNLMRYLDASGDGQHPSASSQGALAEELARKSALSKARYPLDYTFTRAIRQYRLL